MILSDGRTAIIYHTSVMLCLVIHGLINYYARDERRSTVKAVTSGMFLVLKRFISEIKY